MANQAGYPVAMPSTGRSGTGRPATGGGGPNPASIAPGDYDSFMDVLEEYIPEDAMNWFTGMIDWFGDRWEDIENWTPIQRLYELEKGIEGDIPDWLHEMRKWMSEAPAEVAGSVLWHMTPGPYAVELAEDTALSLASGKPLSLSEALSSIDREDMLPAIARESETFMANFNRMQEAEEWLLDQLPWSDEAADVVLTARQAQAAATGAVGTAGAGLALAPYAPYLAGAYGMWQLRQSAKQAAEATSLIAENLNDNKEPEPEPAPEPEMVSEPSAPPPPESIPEEEPQVQYQTDPETEAKIAELTEQLNDLSGDNEALLAQVANSVDKVSTLQTMITALLAGGARGAASSAMSHSSTPTYQRSSGGGYIATPRSVKKKKKKKKKKTSSSSRDRDLRTAIPDDKTSKDGRISYGEEGKL
jgi:hypothetical protein